MIKVYYLKVDKVDNIETPQGISYIHDAILDATEKPDVRKLIMDTTTDEDITLSALAIEVRKATEDEVARLHSDLVMMPKEPTRNPITEIDQIKVIIQDHEVRLKRDIKGHIR